MLTDTQLAEIDERAAHITEYGGATADEERLAGEDVPALLAEVKRLREELAREQEQTRVVRLIGEDNAQRAAYEAMDAERRGWQSRQAIENVTFAELKRDRDRLAARVSELTALLNDTARVTEYLRQLREMDALDGADADRDRLADGGAS